jgi:hypothetical protein
VGLLPAVGRVFARIAHVVTRLLGVALLGVIAR